jgi:hypothetical protein
MLLLLLLRACDPVRAWLLGSSCGRHRASADLHVGANPSVENKESNFRIKIFEIIART